MKTFNKNTDSKFPLFPISLHRNDCKQKANRSFYPIKEDINNTQEFNDFLGYDHVLHTYKGTKRSINNWKGATFLPVDIDNKGLQESDWMTPERFLSIIPDVTCAISFSRNHMKKKNGETPRPKFHAYLKLPYSIENNDTYKSYTYKLSKLLTINGISYTDPAVAKESQCFFGCSDPNAIVINGNTNIVDFLDEHISIQIPDFLDVTHTPKFINKDTNTSKFDGIAPKKQTDSLRILIKELERLGIKFKTQTNSLSLYSPFEKDSPYGYYILYKDADYPIVRHPNPAQSPCSLVLWKAQHYPNEQKTINLSNPEVHTIQQFCTELEYRNLNIKPNSLVSIQSDTGNGKTTFCMELARRSKVILVLPTIAAVKSAEQKQLSFGKASDHFQALYENRKYDPKGHSSMLVTSDKMADLMTHKKEYGLDFSKTILILDEAHNFMVSGNFRPIYRKLKTAFEKRDYKAALFLSGTFDDIDKVCVDIKFDQSIIIKKEIEKPMIIRHIQTDNRITAVSKLVSDTTTKKVIFNNDKNENLALKDSLQKTYGMNSILLNANMESSDQEIMDMIYTLEHIPEDVDVILMTCVGRETLNFNNKNITTLSMSKHLSALDTKQSAARARNGHEHFLITTKPKTDTLHKEINIKYAKKNAIKATNIAIKSLNTFIQAQNEDFGDVDKKAVDSIIQNMKLYTWKENVFVTTDDHANLVMDHPRMSFYLYELDRLNQRNIDYLKEKFKNYNAMLMDHTECFKEDKKLQDQFDIARKKVKQQQKKERIDAIKNINPTTVEEQYKELVDTPRKNNQEKKLQKLFLQYISLSTLGIDHDYTIQTLLKNKYDFVLNKMSFHKNPNHFPFLKILRSLIKVDCLYSSKDRQDLINIAISQYKKLPGFNNLIIKPYLTNCSAHRSKSLFQLVCSCEIHNIRKRSGKKVLSSQKLYIISKNCDIPLAPKMKYSKKTIQILNKLKKKKKVKEIKQITNVCSN